MRSILLLLVAGAMLGGLTQPVQAQQPAASPGVYVVTYFDVDPSAARKADGLLRQFAAATRKEDGYAELTLLREIGRPGGGDPGPFGGAVGAPAPRRE